MALMTRFCSKAAYIQASGHANPAGS